MGKVAYALGLLEELGPLGGCEVLLELVLGLGDFDCVFLARTHEHDLLSLGE